MAFPEEIARSLGENENNDLADNIELCEPEAREVSRGKRQTRNGTSFLICKHC